MPTLEEIRTRFSEDRFAAEAGVEIVEAEPGRAVCEMQVQPMHLNANGVPMGGALFTLADFAFAIAVNGFSEDITVSQQISVTFLAAARGQRIRAEATCLKSGKRTCLYEVKVTDDAGVYVAHLTVNGFTVGKFNLTPAR